MIKKISAGIICIIFAFSVCVFAAEENGTDQTQQYNRSNAHSSGEEHMPRGDRPGGMRGQRPGGGQAGMQGDRQSGERPQMPPDGMGGAPDMFERDIPSDAAFNSAGEFRRENPAEFEKVQTEEDSNMGIIGFLKEYKIAVISLVVLAAAFVFVIFYRRRIF